MDYLMIVATDITNPTWVQEYMAEVTPLVLSHGGRYITRSSAVELLEGDGKPQHSLVAQFPSKEAALNFYHSKEYAPFKAKRQGGSSSQFLLVPIENGTT